MTQEEFKKTTSIDLTKFSDTINLEIQDKR